MRSGLSWLQLTVPSWGPCSWSWATHAEDWKVTFHRDMEVTITKSWNFTGTFKSKSNSTMCDKTLVHPSHQEVKSCKILNEAECQQIRTVSIRSWAKTRFACSSGTRNWNPARPQSSKISTNQNYFNQVMRQDYIQLWNQEVKSCKIPNWANLQANQNYPNQVKSQSMIYILWNS